MPKGYQSPVLHKPSKAYPGICCSCMGPSHQQEHQPARNSPTAGSKICHGGLQDNQQRQQDDLRPRLGISTIEESRYEIGIYIPNHLWSRRHPSLCILPPLNAAYKRPHSALHGPLHRCVPPLLLSSECPPVEPTPGTHRLCLDPGVIQGRAGHSPLAL